MSTSFGPGSGTGSSWRVSTDGGPNRSIAAASIVFFFSTGTLGTLANTRRCFDFGRDPGSKRVSSFLIKFCGLCGQFLFGQPLTQLQSNCDEAFLNCPQRVAADHPDFLRIQA